MFTQQLKNQQPTFMETKELIMFWPVEAFYQLYRIKDIKNIIWINFHTLCQVFLVKLSLLRAEILMIFLLFLLLMLLIKLTWKNWHGKTLVISQSWDDCQLCPWALQMKDYFCCFEVFSVMKDVKPNIDENKIPLVWKNGYAPNVVVSCKNCD